MAEKTALILQTPHDVLLRMANRVRSLRPEQSMRQTELARQVGATAAGFDLYKKTRQA